MAVHYVATSGEGMCYDMKFISFLFFIRLIVLLLQSHD